jgi:Cof subfamily protein (haloacid dehalogenase superfamily)
MKYQAIFIDIDGTLLDRKGNVSSATKESIMRAKKKGIHVVINTGRIYAEAANILNFAGINAPIIAANGAYMTDDTHKIVIYNNTIEKDMLKWMLELSHRHDVSIGLSSLNKFYCDESFCELERKLNLPWQLKEKKGLIDDSVCIKTDEEWSELFNSVEIVKCKFFSCEHEHLDKVRKDMDALGRMEVVSSGKHAMECSNKGVSKASGMLRYLQYYGIQREKSMAIGDSDNDISMIEMAGLGVAMGYAGEELMEKADYITETIDHDGLAMAMNKFLFDE